MTVGPCKLCYKHRELQESHVWPRFAYKQYTSDPSKGGRFVDLGKGAAHNRQYTREWLCVECEQTLGLAEHYTARWLVRLGEHPDQPHDYDVRLLQFVTSVSWRTAVYYLDDATGQYPNNPRALLVRGQLAECYRQLADQAYQQEVEARAAFSGANEETKYEIQALVRKTQETRRKWLDAARASYQALADKLREARLV